MDEILIETRAALGVVTLNRAEKCNAFTLEMFRALTDGLTRLDGDKAIRAIVIHAAGSDFTTGLDLMDVAPSFSQGIRPFSDTVVDPWHVVGRHRKKPLLVAVHGRCYTLGLELVLAADCCIAASDSTFALREVRMGIIPLGAGVVRMLEAVGWSTTMRYALTGDDFCAADAHRMHFVQEVTEPGQQLARALAMAEQLAAAPPARSGRGDGSRPRSPRARAARCDRPHASSCARATRQLGRARGHDGDVRASRTQVRRALARQPVPPRRIGAPLTALDLLRRKCTSVHSTGSALPWSNTQFMPTTIP